MIAATLTKFVNPSRAWFGLAIGLAAIASHPLRGQTTKDYLTFRQAEYDSILNSIRDSKRINFLSLLPSISTDLNGNINVGLSASNYIRYIQQKQRNRIEIQQLELAQKEALNTEMIKLEEKIIILQQRATEIEHDIEILKERYQIHLVQIQEYQNAEIGFTTYTRGRIDYLTSFYKVKKDIQNLSIEIDLIKKRYSINLDVITSIAAKLKPYELTY